MQRESFSVIYGVRNASHITATEATVSGSDRPIHRFLNDFAPTVSYGAFTGIMRISVGFLVG